MSVGTYAVAVANFASRQVAVEAHMPLLLAVLEIPAILVGILLARGKGSRGVRNSAWDASSNVRIEVVCDAATADTIAARLRAHYYDNYAMILFLTDVVVLRPEKF